MISSLQKTRHESFTVYDVLNVCSMNCHALVHLLRNLLPKSLFIHAFHSFDGNETVRLISHSAERIYRLLASDRRTKRKRIAKEQTCILPGGVKWTSDINSWLS